MSPYPGQQYPPQTQYPAPPYPAQTQGYPPQAQAYPPQAPYPGQAPYAQPYPPQMAYPAQPYQPMAAAAPQIFINNTAASAAAAGINAYGLRKRNSFMTHVVLFVLTAGVGNILYAWYVFNWNRKRGL